MKKDDIIRQAVIDLTRKAGQSGTGAAKRRGGKDYYRELALKSAAAKRKKREEREASQ